MCRTSTTSQNIAYIFAEYFIRIGRRFYFGKTFFWIITISVIKNKTVKNGECYDRIKVAVTVLFIKYKKQEVDSEC